MPTDPPSLDYFSPGPMRRRFVSVRELVAYGVFAVSAAVCGYAAPGALWYEDDLKTSLFVFFALCATVLPFLIRKR